MLHGCATPEGTARYAERLRERTAVEHFRPTVTGLRMSSVGLGTYLGQPDAATDAAYEDAVQRALALGCNMIDTAVNYRNQHSERAVGRALAHAVRDRLVARDEVIVATKGGFLPFDERPPEDLRRWIYEEFIESGLAHPNEFAANYQHCIAPAFLDAMIERSRHNLDVDTIDIYYVHNPETQRIGNTHDTFRGRMRAAFNTLEKAVARGAIAAYGAATWTAFRSPPTAPDYLSLTELVGLAFEVAGEDNHFAYVQLPYNLMMTEAFGVANQQVGEGFFSAIAAADQLGLTVVASAALKQGLLAGPFTTDLSRYLPGLATDTQRALQFARSTPGVTSALVGMSQVAHVEENLALAQQSPVNPDIVRELFPD